MNVESKFTNMMTEVRSKLQEIMVLGAGGVGEVVVKGLSQILDVKRIWVADVNLERAEEVVEEVNDARLKAIQLDASDTDAIAEVLKHCGIVIHAGIPRFNLNVMDACLRANCNYIDMASDGPVDMPCLVTIQQQLDYDEAFRKKGLLAVLGIGSDPGVTNILARYAYDRLKTVEEIIVLDGDNSIVKNYAFAIAFSPETSIEETLQPPLVYENGQWNKGLPLVTGIEDFDFPSPVGTLTVRSVAHEEVYTIPRFLSGKGLKRCDFKYALSEQYVEILKGLQVVGLDREEPVKVGDVSVSPRKVVASLLPKPSDLWDSMEGTSCVGVLVKGTDARDMPIEMYLYTMQSHEFSRQNMGVNVTVFQAGVPAVIAAQMILEGKLTMTGVKSPEQFDPEPWIQKLPEWGMPLFVRKLTTEPIQV
jgi:saccharopine dehydrogenase (NAD+, L-lysine-forming)